MKFSIVIPTYNRAYCIEKTIDSVLKQKYTSWELLIIDDLSADNTVQLIKDKYIYKDKRIKLLIRNSDQPKGANMCRNIGIKNSSGEYIALLDSDDRWLPSRLDKAAKYLKSTRADCIFSGALEYKNDKLRIRNSRGLQEGENYFDFLLSDDTYAPSPSLILKSTIAKVINFDVSLHRHQDYDFFIRVGGFYKWEYFENFDVIVDNDAGKDKKINFDSCTDFYLRHRHLSTNKNIRVSYIKGMAESCVKNNLSKQALHFYKNQLVSESVRLNFRFFFLLYFPYAFRKLFILKNKII